MGRVSFSVWAMVVEVLLLSAAAAGQQPPADQKPIGEKGAAERGKEDAARGRVIYNLDCSEFFVGTFGPIVPQTIDKFVDGHAALGITDLFINVNAKRTNYRSDVWESDWDGYDPAAGDDQPFFTGIGPQGTAASLQYIKNTLALHEQGCDYGKRMIDAARRAGLKAWISLRMNDDHNPHLPNHPCHSTFWKSHQEWRLSYGLDYEQPEVREHYMKLIREVSERYDLDGLELDFLRFPFYFRNGREHEGAKLMTAFVKEARGMTREAAKRWGHPVKLAVRVPSTPWIARRNGLDAVSWGQAGLVDLIVTGGWYLSADSDVPIEAWKGLLIGTDVAVALSVETSINSGGSGLRSMSAPEMRGFFASGWHRGADALYLFNIFATPYHNWPREEHDQLLRDAGSYAALRATPRRHALTITHPWAAGERGDGKYLPYVGTHGVFRLYVGPRPLPGQGAQIELVTPDRDQPLDARLNGIPCPRSRLVDHRHYYDVPPEALSDGYNLIEASAKQNFTITWVEISVQ